MLARGWRAFLLLEIVYRLTGRSLEHQLKQHQELLQAKEEEAADLRREIKEETDLDITDIQFVLVQDCIHSKEFYRDAHFVLLNYTCQCLGTPEVKLNDEAREFRWVAPAAALDMEINQPTRTLLLAVVEKNGIPLQ